MKKPIESEEFINWMVDTLGITVDRRPKGNPVKGKIKLQKK